MRHQPTVHLARAAARGVARWPFRRWQGAAPAPPSCVFRRGRKLGTPGNRESWPWVPSAPEAVRVAHEEVLVGTGYPDRGDRCVTAEEKKQEWEGAELGLPVAVNAEPEVRGPKRLILIDD